MIVVVALFCFVSAQAGDDLGGGAPLEGPSAADLGAEPKAPDAPPPPPAKKKPKPAATPTTTTTVAAPPPPPPPPPQAPPAQPKEIEEKAKKLRADVDALLNDFGGDKPKALQQKIDALLGGWVADGVTIADPELKPLMKLLKLRAALLAGRFDDADTALKEAHTVGDPVVNTLDSAPARRLSAAMRYFGAAIVEARARHDLFETPSCGNALGLKRLASDEARDRRKLVDGVADRYGAVAHGPDRFWGRRAAFAVAALSDDMARSALVTPSFRGVTLPSPSSIETQDTTALLQPMLAQWIGEIRRSYDELVTTINAREPDPELSEAVRARAAALSTTTIPEGELLENPWRKDLKDGVIRVVRRPERMNASHRFVPIETKVALVELQNQMKLPVGSVEQAWALVSLASLGADKVSVDDVKAALGHSDPRVVVAGLMAAEKVVDGKGGAEKAVALRESVSAVYVAALAAAPKAKPFATVQASLFAPLERSILALQAIARADRTAADAIVADDRIPAFERAWMIAELLDGRFAARFDTWGWDKDERVAALAIYGGVTARGKNAGYMLRAGDPGLVGCVSRAAAPK